jgi:hypothetical protein
MNSRLTTTSELLTRDIPSEWTPIAEDGAVIALPSSDIRRRDAKRKGLWYGERVILTNGTAVLYQEIYGGNYGVPKLVAHELIDLEWHALQAKFGISAAADDVKFMPFRDGKLFYLTAASESHACFAAIATFGNLIDGLEQRRLTYAMTRTGSNAVSLAYEAIDFMTDLALNEGARPRTSGKPLIRDAIETEFAAIDAGQSRVIFKGRPGIIGKREARITAHRNYMEHISLAAGSRIIFEESAFGTFEGAGWTFMTTVGREQARQDYGFSYKPDDIKRTPFRDGILFYVSGLATKSGISPRICFLAEALFDREPGFGTRRVQVYGTGPSQRISDAEVFVTKVIADHLDFKEGPAPWPPAA